MLRALRPSAIPPPFARYSHGVEVVHGTRLVFCSGQLGIRSDGEVPDSVEAQAELCFENIRAILAVAGLDLTSIVRLNAFVTRREDMRGYMSIRDRFVADPPPASTLVIVSGFTRPEFLVEVGAVAAAFD
jgi:enamine deaminase RidA (YjgF/YER057c/UK114 family)